MMATLVQHHHHPIGFLPLSFSFSDEMIDLASGSSESLNDILDNISENDNTNVIEEDDESKECFVSITNLSTNV